MVNVVITAKAQEQHQAAPKTIRGRLDKVYVRLANWPAVSGAKPLGGSLVGRYRVRTGDYRVQFFIESAPKGEGKSIGLDTLVIEKVGHRDGFYEE